jgi:hypothetical protein
MSRRPTSGSLPIAAERVQRRERSKSARLGLMHRSKRGIIGSAHRRGFDHADQSPKAPPRECEINGDRCRFQRAVSAVACPDMLECPPLGLETRDGQQGAAKQPRKAQAQEREAQTHGAYLCVLGPPHEEPRRAEDLATTSSGSLIGCAWSKHDCQSSKELPVVRRCFFSQFPLYRPLLPRSLPASCRQLRRNSTGVPARTSWRRAVSTPKPAARNWQINESWRTQVENSSSRTALASTSARNDTDLMTGALNASLNPSHQHARRLRSSKIPTTCARESH